MESMKRILIMLFSVILVAFVATAFCSPKEKVVVKDVGYSLTIDQNIAVPAPAIAPPSILLARGVSVPYKGLSNDAISIITYSKFQMCRIDNYSYTWQRSISTYIELPDMKPTGKETKLNNNGATRLDIGEITYLQNIV
jgi:hypothetical protein